MERGGTSWAGWQFSTWGRARDWFVIAPSGTRYSAAEIDEIPRLQADVSYLMSRCRQLETLLAAKPVGLTPRERLILQQAAAILASAGAPAAEIPRFDALEILAK
jgi:hypothetical protein